MRKHNSNSKQMKIGKGKDIKSCIWRCFPTAWAKFLGARWNEPSRDSWKIPRNNMWTRATLRHLKFDISGKVFPTKGFRTGKAGPAVSFLSNAKKSKVGDVPHKSFCKLVDKIIDFNPVICHTPRPEKMKINWSEKQNRGLNCKHFFNPIRLGAGSWPPKWSMRLHLRSWNFSVWTALRKPGRPHSSGGSSLANCLVWDQAFQNKNTSPHFSGNANHIGYIKPFFLALMKGLWSGGNRANFREPKGVWMIKGPKEPKKFLGWDMLQVAAHSDPKRPQD